MNKLKVYKSFETRKIISIHFIFDLGFLAAKARGKTLLIHNSY